MLSIEKKYIFWEVWKKHQPQSKTTRESKAKQQKHKTRTQIQEFNSIYSIYKSCSPLFTSWEPCWVAWTLTSGFTSHFLGRQAIANLNCSLKKQIKQKDVLKILTVVF